MLRFVLYVTLLMALFVGVALSGGNAIGAWEPAVPPVPTSSVKDETGKNKTQRHKQRKAHAKATKKQR
jgi:hypothetical protein